MPRKIKQVRFAYQNTVYSPPPPFPPPLTHSVSTAPSSNGPITPPTIPYSLPRPPVGVPYTSSSSSQHTRPIQPVMYIPPQKAPSSSSRYSGPSRAHRYLGPDAIVWDLMDHPSAIIRHRQHLSSRALTEPATEPPMKFISITSPYLPWTFKIYASNGQYVSLQDVLENIYRTLRINITQSEFNSFNDKKRATRAYEERYRRLRSQRLYEEEKRSGMKRIDLLLGCTRFVGITNDGRRPEEWHLRVS